MSNLQTLCGDSQISHLRVHRQEILLKQVTEEVTLELQEVDTQGFHPLVIERLKAFNGLSASAREMLLKFARRVQKSMPEKVSLVLNAPPPENPPAPIISIAQWCRDSDQIRFLHEYATTVIEIVKKKPAGRKVTMLKAQLRAMGVTVNWELAVDPPATLWCDPEVRNWFFCLVDRGTNLPLLHKPYSYNSVSGGDYGSHWNMLTSHRRFDNNEPADGIHRAVPLTQSTFREATFLEILAMLSTATGMPNDSYLKQL